jgi:hypothetical protein
MSGPAFVSVSATAPQHLFPLDVMRIPHLCPAPLPRNCFADN